MVLDYYQQWIGDTIDESQGESFIEMLNKKATFCSMRNKKIYAYDGLKTGAEIDTILRIAMEIQADGGFDTISE